MDDQFRSASRTSDVLRKCAIAEKEKRPGKVFDAAGSKLDFVFVAGKMRTLAAMLKTSKFPPLPPDLNHLTYEEFVISQNPAAIERLNLTLDNKLTIVKNYFVWNEKEAVFWTWLRQNVNAQNFCPIVSEAELKLNPEAKTQLDRVDKIEAALAKVPKPRFDILDLHRLNWPFPKQILAAHYAFK